MENFSDGLESFQIIQKNPRQFRHFSVYPESFQTIWKLSRLSENSPNHPKAFRSIQKISMVSRYFPGYLKIFKINMKLPRLSGHFPDYPETFQIIQKLSRPSSNFSDYMDTFQTIRKLPSAISRVTRKNFPDGNATMVFVPLIISTFFHSPASVTLSSQSSSSLATSLPRFGVSTYSQLSQYGSDSLSSLVLTKSTCSRSLGIVITTRQHCSLRRKSYQRRLLDMSPQIQVK